MPCTATGLRAAMATASSRAPCSRAALSGKTRLRGGRKKRGRGDGGALGTWGVGGVPCGGGSPHQAAALRLGGHHLARGEGQLVDEAAGPGGEVGSLRVCHRAPPASPTFGCPRSWADAAECPRRPPARCPPPAARGGMRGDTGDRMGGHGKWHGNTGTGKKARRRGLGTIIAAFRLEKTSKTSIKP